MYGCKTHTKKEKICSNIVKEELFLKGNKSVS